METLYFEDIDSGEVRDLGKIRVKREEMLDFARQYDPQPIHTDPTAAAESIYGELIASGWFTASLCMRVLATELLTKAASMGAFGLEELRWPTPVRAGDVLTIEHEVLATNASSSRGDRGYVDNELRATNQADELVLTWRATNIFQTRPNGTGNRDVTMS